MSISALFFCTPSPDSLFVFDRQKLDFRNYHVLLTYLAWVNLIEAIPAELQNTRVEVESNNGTYLVLFDLSADDLFGSLAMFTSLYQ